MRSFFIRFLDKKRKIKNQSWSHETNNLLWWSRLVVIVKVYLSLLWPQSHWNLLIVCSCFREILLHVPQYWRENNTSSARSLHNIMVTVPTVSVESRWRRDKYRQSDKALPSRTGILRPSDYCIDTLQYDYWNKKDRPTTLSFKKATTIVLHLFSHPKQPLLQ